ncbi:MAG: hypothetical protein JWL63_3122 [Rhodocyclales bacterium]|nr:hypothetical protein [Rhodocyclales bacterium]
MAELFRTALIALAIALPFAAPAVSSAGTGTASTVVKPAGSDWAHLTPAQREILAPFAADWNSFSAVRKLKWIGIADRYPKMTPPEQANVRERMGEWSKLTPQDREKAREQYKKLRTAPPAERRQLEQKWREYDALPDEQKLALKAAPKAPPAPANAASAPSVLGQGARPPKPVVMAPHIVKPSRKTLPAPLQSAPAGQSVPARTNP